MRLFVHGHDVEVTPDLRFQVERRILSGLERFGRRVGTVTVRLQRPVDGAGGLWTCHILVDLHPSGGLGLGETAPELLAAVDRASERVGAAAARELARRHARRDGRASGYAML